MANYGISDDDGNQITNGLQTHVARQTAQRMADERDESVWLWQDGCEDDDEKFSPRSHDAQVEILIGTPNGDVIEYGAEASAASVESAAGNEWRVDYDTTPVKFASGRFRSPIFRRGA